MIATPNKLILLLITFCAKFRWNQNRNHDARFSYGPTVWPFGFERSDQELSSGMDQIKVRSSVCRKSTMMSQYNVPFHIHMVEFRYLIARTAAFMYIFHYTAYRIVRGSTSPSSIPAGLLPVPIQQQQLKTVLQDLPIYAILKLIL
jgi:hypothetical protein